MKQIVYCLLLLFVSCSSGDMPKQILAKVLSSEAMAATNEDTLLNNASRLNSEVETISFALCGDIMLGTTFPEEKLPADDGRNLFRDTKGITQRVDVAVGNLEGVLCDYGISTKEEGPNTYSFMMPTRYAPLLSDAGFDFLSMANNHANDFGIDGIISTETCLDRQSIKYAGIAGRTSSVVIERKGRRIGLCAFGHNGYTLRIQDLERVKTILDNLKEECDIVVVSFHGGAEGKTKNHVPYGTEMFLDEDRGDVRTFAHFCIDNGADIVYGHGPHVARCIELYDGRFIAYSLGNFCTPCGINLTGISGYSPLIEIEINKHDGKFVRGKIHPFIQQPRIGPRKDIKGSVIKEIRQLTDDDIPDNNLSIKDNGDIVL